MVLISALEWIAVSAGVYVFLPIAVGVLLLLIAGILMGVHKLTHKKTKARKSS